MGVKLFTDTPNLSSFQGTDRLLIYDQSETNLSNIVKDCQLSTFLAALPTPVSITGTGTAGTAGLTLKNGSGTELFSVLDNGVIKINQPTSGNIFIRSASINPTGTNNTILGLGNNFSSATTASDNISIGNSSLGTITTGSRNTVVGLSAGVSLTTGSDNIFLGRLAGGLNTTGQKNICIGAQAGTVNNTDSSGIAIGTLAKASANNFVAGSITDPITNVIFGSGEVLAGTGTHAGVDYAIKGANGYDTGATARNGGSVFLKGGTGVNGGANGHISITDTAGNIKLQVNDTGLGFFAATPVTQPSSTGETTGFTAGAGTSVNDDSTFTGNVGSTAYRISDIVKHLKNLGLIAQ